jgi:hypothetical protein
MASTCTNKRSRLTQQTERYVLGEGKGGGQKGRGEVEGRRQGRGGGESESLLSMLYCYILRNILYNVFFRDFAAWQES